MAKLNSIKRILKEDFDEKDRPLIEKLAFPINQFIEQVNAAFNKGITIEDNLAQEIKTFTIEVDVNGAPVPALQFKTNLRVRGMIIIRADNIEDNTALTGAPFAQWSVNTNIVTVSRIVGLPAAKDFSISIVLQG